MNSPANVQITPPPSAPRPEGRWASLRADLRESVRGTQQDFTQGSLGRAIVLLSVPTILEMSMESLFGIVDVFWVASLGADAVAAVGLTEGLLTLIFAAAMGLCMGTTAMVARRIGEKDATGAAVAAVQSILLGLLISLPIGLGGALFAPQLFRMMGASPEVVSTGSSFGAIMLGGNATIFLLFLINAIFRGAGDAVSAMRALWIGNAVNLLLDPCLIFGWGPFPEMGITGNAIATNIGRGIGVLYQVSVIIRGNGRLMISREQIRIDWPVLWRLLKVSLSGMFQFLIPMASYLVLVRMVSMFGSAALAGYTIALRIIIVAILPAWGMCNAAATLVGQNLGAKQPDAVGEPECNGVIEHSMTPTQMYAATRYFGYGYQTWIFLGERRMFTCSACTARPSTSIRRAIALPTAAHPRVGWGTRSYFAFPCAAARRMVRRSAISRSVTAQAILASSRLPSCANVSRRSAAPKAARAGRFPTAPFSV